MPINYLQQIQQAEFNDTGYRISPSPELTSIIEGFYVFQKEAGQQRHLIFNDGFPAIVFLPEYRDTVSVTDQNNTTHIQGAWVNGGSIKNTYVEYKQIDQLFIVRFHPRAFYQLFMLDTAYFRHRAVVPFNTLAQRNGFAVQDFFTCNTLQAKTLFIEDHIRHLSTVPQSQDELQATLLYMQQAQGIDTVSTLSKNTGVNYKWLERFFIKNIGLLPKEYIQMHRFLEAHRILTSSSTPNLMKVAVATGYYDANHFLKDFKLYTGKTPLEYLRLNQTF